MTLPAAFSTLASYITKPQNLQTTGGGTETHGPKPKKQWLGATPEKVDDCIYSPFAAFSASLAGHPSAIQSNARRNNLTQAQMNINRRASNLHASGTTVHPDGLHSP